MPERPASESPMLGLLDLLRRVLASKALWGFISLTVLAVVLLRWGGAVAGPEGLWARFGWFAPLGTVPLHALIAVTPFPSDVAGVANGAVYGLALGSVFSWLGWFVASFIQYALGHRFGSDFDVAAWRERSPKRLRRFPVRHPAFLIFGRYVPYVGGHLVTLVPGALGVPLVRFAWCTALSIIPQAVLTAGIGAGLWLLR